MLRDRIEGKWIDLFGQVFELCKVEAGEAVAILSESQSRQLNVNLAELALLRLGARPFHVVLPSPAQTVSVPIRSTGASQAVQGLEPVITALAASGLVVDCTVEGMLHAPELGKILGGGARLLMISNEHPDALERLAPSPELTPKVKLGLKQLVAAHEMRVKSEAGTDLTVDVSEARVGGVWGYCDKPKQVAHWPGGLCLCFPAKGTTNGTLVLDRGDVNLTFKRYLESPIRLTVEDDYVTKIDGDGTDAALMRSYFEAWDDKDAYAVSHVGWGMNPAARWDAMTMYDRRDVNGTEQRAFAGNFLYSTGANEVAKRYTAGHFDLPMRNCTISLDGEVIVDKGTLQGGLL
jgi:2,5-dihydroxypyridine 5,6-dioxygenase